jgi:hypothetical protein
MKWEFSRAAFLEDDSGRMETLDHAQPLAPLSFFPRVDSRLANPKDAGVTVAGCVHPDSRLSCRSMTRTTFVKFAPALFAVIYSAAAQMNDPATNAPSLTNRTQALQLSEQTRAQCIAGRRSICGKILRVFPDGILVESGYTNLARGTLTKSWLVPGSVVAGRATGLVESREPGAFCVGTVFLTDLPRGKPHPYDYVVIAGYPTGEFTYTSVGTIRKTVRRFSANLDKAVKTDLAASEQRATK